MLPHLQVGRTSEPIEASASIAGEPWGRYVTDVAAADRHGCSSRCRILLQCGMKL
jgi:hypothetical protein